MPEIDRPSFADAVSRSTIRAGAVASVLALLVGVAAPAPAAEATASRPPTLSLRPAWDLRGDAVESRFDAYRSQLQSYYEALQETLAAAAPDLRDKLKAAAPAATPYGYGILPEIEPDPATAAAAPPVQRRAESKSYSWPWTEVRIGGEAKKIEAASAELNRAKTLDAVAQRALWEKLATSYGVLRDAQRNIEEHVHYNRQWQAAIAGEREAYDRSTVQHDLTVERQNLLDVMQAKDEAAYLAALAKVRGVDGTLPRAELEVQLREREAALGRKIHDVIDAVRWPAYIRVVHPSAHRWIIRVPMRTDIDDRMFLGEFRRRVAKVWSVRDGDDEYRVHVSITRITVGELYRGCSGTSEQGAAARCVAPKPGEHLDTKAHAARFPRTTAGLTTGAGRPFTIQGVIVLGSAKIKAHVLAHEFGHVLGFRDEYFRGYHDLGADGYQVVEIVADPGDVMGDPDAGPVRGEMMRRLVAAARPGL